MAHLFGKKSFQSQGVENTGVKEISKYTKKRKPFHGYIKGTPIHVKSSINYNDLLYKNKIKNTTNIFIMFVAIYYLK